MAGYTRESRIWEARQHKYASGHIYKEKPNGMLSSVRRAWCSFESTDGAKFGGVREGVLHHLACADCRAALPSRKPVERSRPLTERGPHLGFSSQAFCGGATGAASVHYVEGECAACLVEADAMLEQGLISMSAEGLLLDQCAPQKPAPDVEPEPEVRRL